MKTTNVSVMLLVTLLTWNATLYGEADERPYIGVLLDTSPLPDLLAKHLELPSGRGIRVSNVVVGSPADEAGLERDDIIVQFQDQDIEDYQEFVDQVREASVGVKVSLEIIHLGKRKTIELELGATKDEPEWKYPTEPAFIESWQPKRMFRLKPGEKGWNQIPFEKTPWPRVEFKKFFKELYSFHHSEDGESYSVTIEGSPNDDDTEITVRIGNDEYKTGVNEIDELPKKYRSIAEEALEDARKASRRGKRKVDIRFESPWPQGDRGRIFKDQRFQPDLPQPPFWPDSPMLEEMEKRIEKLVEELQERIEKLEKQNSEFFDRYPDKPDKSKPTKDKSQIQPDEDRELKV
ncbi:MAG: PDZ domain-containing protein [Phycisphaerales bacterium]|nr:MAG: PDZ domain-containing protein [Phycisphaerales bacterium]